MDEIRRLIDKSNTIHKIMLFLNIVILVLMIVRFLTTRQAPQPDQTPDYVTRDEVHEIVDSILTEIYD